MTKTVYEIATATNRITGKQMIFAANVDETRWFLIINGLNVKASDRREVIENYFTYLSAK